MILNILVAILLWSAASGKAQAAAPNALQEALGAPPPSEFAPPPGQNPFKEPLRRSAPFIGIGEEAARPPASRNDPQSFKPLPMTGTGPQKPHAPQAPVLKEKP